MEIRITPSALKVIKGVRDQAKSRKVQKCIRKLEADSNQRSLHSHRYEALDKVHGQKIWESYVEENVPSAWRVWWFFGPEDGQLTIVAIGPHP